MTATIEPSLGDLWRRQIGRRDRNRDPRPLAALGYLANGPVIEDLIEVEKLVLVVVHDETTARGNLTTRVAGYLIRVNRQPVAANQALQEGDRVSFTPTKIEGAVA